MRHFAATMTGLKHAQARGKDAYMEYLAASEMAQEIELMKYEMAEEDADAEQAGK